MEQTLQDFLADLVDTMERTADRMEGRGMPHAELDLMILRTIKVAHQLWEPLTVEVTDGDIAP